MMDTICILIVALFFGISLACVRSAGQMEK
jgi:hypothetical protein